MDCNHYAESGIDIVKPMVTDLAHWINVVLVSINIKECRTSRVCDECTILSSCIAIVVVILI